MYRFHAGLSRRAKFEPTDNHHYLDIIQYATDGQEPAVKHGTLKHDEINPWLEREVLKAREYFPLLRTNHVEDTFP
jgi:hypothetical protein